ncbi:transmembrane emp24 domain-containing protein [Leishmania donovani]|uniref:Transmembrane_emp24_domain-containing_protein n=4 Tax=Leishmania donovani species complex TaxID=38574 RepID=A0A6L0XWP4_LEIIN|nr:COP-coated vesicle membrane protein erv25 precursor [Leishmania infantum JPCM5]XP_003865343.1 COP-coated vesicle membrane protein erv25 precursor, putative [Leishmania donovani]CAC9550181.1 transmembrane_emp24_domain-containing_protein [Leishmania infantum]AYU83575.1 transmembrane emp24 domain-containing protein [Leishmania donovani]CAJ1993589.1 transmembrane emp24 domain-containing protein [Leishmania donovani]CAM72920.1 COP-coated vesicle membrane protein erv25 precursor [Leishmania infan|eukprot:XP_001469808.1 COP-coated vesicle membrane protein erv25 precursor [Leishmania infantum JPCM5]
MMSSSNGGARAHWSRRGIPQLLLLLVGFAVALQAATPAQALTYHFVDSKPLCFSEIIENVQTSQITGVYDWKPSAHSPASQVRLRLSAKDGTGNVYYDKEMMEGEHSFAVQLNPNVLSGEQLICFTASSNFVASEEKPVKVSIELDQAPKNEFNADKVVVETIQKRRQIDGLDVYTYQEAGGELKDILQPRAYLETIDRELSAMERLLDQLVTNLGTSVMRESRMRETSESTFTRVWVCALLLIGIISGVLWMQFRFLKSTLRKKKLL